MAEFFATLKSDFIKCFVTKNRWTFITEGLSTTLKITLLSCIMGIVIGLILAIVRSTYDKNYKEMHGGIGKSLLAVANFIANIYLTVIRGTPVVELRQSFLDEKNEQVMINPQFAYVLPSGKEKIVKVLLEGATQMYDVVNPDQSIEIHTYKKMGAAILTHHNWGIYQNTSIPDTSDFPYGI